MSMLVINIHAKHDATLTVNFQTHAVNCEQDWKASGHRFISVVSSRNNIPKNNHDSVSYSLF